MATALGFGQPSATLAADLGYALTTGPGHFESHAIDSGFDFGAGALRFDAGYYKADSPSLRLEQFTGAVRWNVTDKDSVSLSSRQIDDEVVLITGAALGASVSLDRFWQGSHSTTLSLSASRNAYSPETQRRLAAAVVNRYPDQTGYSIGLKQGLPGDLTLGLNHDRYRYSSDPADLATRLAVLFGRFGRYPPNQAFTLAGFPDRATSASLSGFASEKLGLSASVSQTNTVIDQRLRSLTVGLNYTDGAVTLGSSITRSASSEIRSPNSRLTLAPASMGTYLEFRISATF